MPVTQGYIDYVLDQLAALGPVDAKRMFGGVGLYSGGSFFGLIAADVLYFKVDESTRSGYESAGMGPFRPYGKDSYAMQYYEVPADVLEDPDQLQQWAEGAISVAKQKQASGKRKK
ncbi:MAG TPA: competence protein TfoX [Nitrospiraceae bacterium]|nr:competence protein TfoX [Nitrospiraceae bacterium]